MMMKTLAAVAVLTIALAGHAAAQSANPVTDSNNAAFQGVIVITPGTPVTAGRSLAYVCTASGTITVTFLDTSTLTVTLTASTSIQTLPFAVTNVALGTATGSFWNLK